MRGLAIHNGHTIVTASKPRDGSFKELALQGEIGTHDGEPWCGVFAVNLRHGDIVEWIELDGAIAKLSNLVALLGLRCPMSLGISTAKIQNAITFENPESFPTTKLLIIIC